MTSLNTKLLFSLAPVGILMGTLMVFGVGNPWIIILWMVFCIGTALLLAATRQSGWILHAILIGVIWGILHNVVESIFFDDYLANNPGYEDALSNPDAIPARYWVLLTGPMAGFGTGVLIAVFTWIIRLVYRQRVQNT